ncbi:MAG TPA: hypothetical protein DEA08_06800 [Planctomycetes bacterium]|nr:hypothetical protein [Planctomycetota bacterium]
MPQFDFVEKEASSQEVLAQEGDTWETLRDPEKCVRWAYKVDFLDSSLVMWVIELFSPHVITQCWEYRSSNDATATGGNGFQYFEAVREFALGSESSEEVPEGVTESLSWDRECFLLGPLITENLSFRGAMSQSHQQRSNYRTRKLKAASQLGKQLMPANRERFLRALAEQYGPFKAPLDISVSLIYDATGKPTTNLPPCKS